MESFWFEVDRALRRSMLKNGGEAALIGIARGADDPPNRRIDFAGANRLEAGQIVGRLGESSQSRNAFRASRAV